MTKILSLLLVLSFLLALFGCADDKKGTNTDDTDSANMPVVDVSYTAAHLNRIESLEHLALPDINSIFTFLKLQVPDAANLVAGLSSDVSVYRMTYQTTYNGAPVMASALLAIPDAATPLPVLSFQNGTNTVKADAPTESYDTPVMQMISATASLGYVIAVTDYLGFGESAQLVHPYLCREATVTPLLDMLSAVTELEEDATDPLQFSLSGDLFLMGYSQGGHATMALHEQLERTPDFPLVLQATAAGAGPYDIMAVNQYILSQPEYPMPVFGPYTILAFQSLGFVPNDLSLFFAAPYAAAIPGLFDGTKTEDEINAGLTTSPAALYTPMVITTTTNGTTDDAAGQALLAAFADNSVPAFAATSPIRLSHGSTDTYIPAAETEAFAQRMIAAGTPEANISILTIPDKDHQTAAPFAIVDAISWFNSRRGI